MTQTGSLSEPGGAAGLHEATGAADAAEVASLYDRFTGLYDMMFRINRYQRSVEHYLQERRLPLATGARVLDAGCGTGLLTLSLLRVLERPARITSVDLSASSLETARRAAAKVRPPARHTLRFVHSNAMRLPFADDSFDLLVTSGVLEYLPLAEGMTEFARVVAPGGYFLHLPCVPLPMTRLLELMFRFKAHPPRDVLDNTTRHFRILEQHRFAPHEPIGWSKTAILAQKP
jgi:ubiquinone/menaquinone biosynthesis C-methylase UbiE